MPARRWVRRGGEVLLGGERRGRAGRRISCFASSVVKLHHPWTDCPQSASARLMGENCLFLLASWRPPSRSEMYANEGKKISLKVH